MSRKSATQKLETEFLFMKEIRQLEATEYIEYVDGGKHALKNAAVSPFHEGFDSAGKKLKANEVVVDIDGIDKKIIKQIITFFDIKTEIRWTNRGAHFYYTKPKGYKHKASGVCPLGFKVEWKIAEKTPSVTVKRNGVLREPENEHVREELPEFFIYKPGLKSLLGMEDEEGRNSGLFAYRMKISNLENWKQILTFINRHIFAQPLDEKELASILRDGVNFDTEKDSAYEVAMTLVQKLKIVKFCNLLYSYDGTCYHNSDYFKYDVAKELAGQSSRYIDEVFKQMELHLFPIQEPTEGWKVKFKNGYLSNGHWCDMDYTDFTPYYIDLSYNPNAEPVLVVDDFLNTFTDGDEDYKKLILETLAHCLITDVKVKKIADFQRVTFFIGDGGNGKGTLLSVIRNLLGSNNVSSISLDRIIDERYLFSMFGKLANCGDDIENKVIKEEKMKMLKNLCSYDAIPLRKMYEQSMDKVISATQIFTTNHLLKSFEKGAAWKRRAIWCPSFAKPTKDDPYFQEKILSPESMEYWLKLVVEAYFRLYENRKFTESKKVNDYTAFYHMENNTCIEWIRDAADESQILGCRTPEVHAAYEIWAEENGLNVQSIKQLNKTIEEELGFHILSTRRNKMAIKIWAKK
jgi:putative DNA primase/helicase